MSIFLCLVLCIALGACNSDDNSINTSPFFCEAYAPIVEVTECIFLMDSIVFGIEGDVFFKDTTIYFLKEQVEEAVEFDGCQFIAIDQYNSESLSGPFFAINSGLVKRQIRMLYSKYNTGGILDYENFIEAGYQLEQTLIFQ